MEAPIVIAIEIFIPRLVGYVEDPPALKVRITVNQPTFRHYLRSFSYKSIRAIKLAGDVRRGKPLVSNIERFQYAQLCRW